MTSKTQKWFCRRGHGEVLNAQNLQRFRNRKRCRVNERSAWENQLVRVRYINSSPTIQSYSDPFYSCGRGRFAFEFSVRVIPSGPGIACSTVPFGSQLYVQTHTQTDFSIKKQARLNLTHVRGQLSCYWSNSNAHLFGQIFRATDALPMHSPHSGPGKHQKSSHRNFCSAGIQSVRRLCFGQ